MSFVTNLKTGKQYEFDTFSKEIYSDYINVNSIIIKKYNLDVNSISKTIKETLDDEVLINCYDKALKQLNEKPLSNKRFFLTDDDLESYITISVNEVIKKINELR